MKATTQPVKWPAEAIWEQIAPILPNFTVEVLPEIDSTNTELMRRAKAGQIEPILLVAEKQTAGRGRLGREWHDLAERTDSLPALTFSLGLPLSPLNWSGLSLAVGLSIATSLHADIGLKWPNDLWLNDRKLAGILIETCAVVNSVGNQRYVVIGVGINITKPQVAQDIGQDIGQEIGREIGEEIDPTLPVPHLRRAPAWLQELIPTIDASDALLRIAPDLIQTLLVFVEQGFAPFQARFHQRDVLCHRQINVDDNQIDVNNKISGIALGVNSNGELEMQTAHGIKAINSSEVSIRPL
jgi:BirA family transcriptional regulator, biotin operon repressor / biotin---[acetyl-CoA-carboxylase] ligase